MPFMFFNEIKNKSFTMFYWVEYSEFETEIFEIDFSGIFQVYSAWIWKIFYCSDKKYWFSKKNQNYFL